MLITVSSSVCHCGPPAWSAKVQATGSRQPRELEAGELEKVRGAGLGGAIVGGAIGGWIGVGLKRLTGMESNALVVLGAGGGAIIGGFFGGPV